MSSNVRDNVVFTTPRTEGERVEIAESCVRRLGIRFPALIDGMANSTERRYTGWPDRLMLIDTEGRLVYKTEAGPFGFKPAQLEAALVRLLH
jgi:type I thyroxine 5'-deiodinase